MNNRHNFIDFGGLTDIFDQLFKDPGVFSGCNLYPETFPPANIILKANKDLVFEFAIAGYTQEDIDLSFEGDNMVIEFKRIKLDEEESDSYLIRGIKTSGKKNKYIVPYAKYAIENTKASMKNGILKVTVPAKEEEKPRKVKIEI